MKINIYNMVTDEQKKNAQNIGLDLTNSDNSEIISGYIHFEENKSIDEEDRESKIINKRSYIKTRFNRFRGNI